MSFTFSKNGFSPPSPAAASSFSCGMTLASSSSRCFFSPVRFLRHARPPRGARRRSSRYVGPFVSDQRRHPQRAAERQRGVGDRHLAIEVVPFAMEELV